MIQLWAWVPLTGTFIPKIKLSENAEKITNPGNKTIRRIYDKENGKIIADLICLVDEEYDTAQPLLLFDPKETWKKTLLAPGTYTMREMMIPVFLKGECVYESPKVMDIQKYCKSELATLWKNPCAWNIRTGYTWICLNRCGI